MLTLPPNHRTSSLDFRNHVYALDAGTGDLRWSSQDDSLVLGADGVVYVIDDDDVDGQWQVYLRALDSGDKWNYTTEGQMLSTTVGGGVVYVSSGCYGNDILNSWALDGRMHPRSVPRRWGSTA